MEQAQQTQDDINALEATPDVAGGGSDDSLETGGSSSSLSSTPSKPKLPPKKKMGDRVRGLVVHLNIYLLLFVLILVVAGVIVYVGIQRNKKELQEPTLTTQELTTEALKEINQSETKVGDPKQTLTIESNAIFSGKVLVRDSLDVAGTIKVGGALNLPGITVSGSSNFDQIQANRLAVAGDASVQGTLSVQKNLTVAGGATFGGPISAPLLSVQSLQISNDLTITRHIDAGGPTPSKSDGSALGAGGTASVSGTDTAGTVTINTGGAPSAGCFITINFTTKFGSTPHVVLTPVGSAAAGLNWYINRTTTSFSVCTTNPAPVGQNFAFDYIALD